MTEGISSSRGHIGPVQGAGSSERPMSAKSRGSSPRRMDTRRTRIGHVRIGHLDDGFGRSVDVETERVCDLLLDRVLEAAAVQGHLAIGEVGAQAIEPEVRVGVRRFLAAAAIADGAGVGSR